jgi:antitoxin ParD1/3/4/toxin ParE1/3/4
MGHLREDLADEALRFWRVYSYMIIYRPDSQPLEIVRVLHGARDTSTLFQ